MRKFHTVTKELIEQRGQILATNNDLPLPIGMALYVATTNLAALVLHFTKVSPDQLRVASMRDSFSVTWSLLDDGFRLGGKIHRAIVEALDMAFHDCNIEPDAARVFEFLEHEGFSFEPLLDKDGKPVIN